MSETHNERNRGRSILQAFVGNALLWSAIYFFVGNVFHQNYLGAFGVRVGIINTLVPDYTDPWILGYSALLWLAFIQLPDRWYKRIAELVNPATWRYEWDYKARIVGFFAFLAAYFIMFFVYAIRSLNGTGSFWAHLVTLTTFFASTDAFLGSLILGIVMLLIYRHYTSIRRKQLFEITAEHLSTMLIVLQAIVPTIFIYGFITFGLVVPAWYGNIRAQIDLRQMYVGGVGRIEHMVVNSDLCPPTETVVRGESLIYSNRYAGKARNEDVIEEPYVPAPIAKDLDMYNGSRLKNGTVSSVTDQGTSLHSLGTYNGKEYFVGFPFTTSVTKSLTQKVTQREPVKDFIVCAMDQSAVQSVQLTTPYQFQASGSAEENERGTK